MSRQCEKPRWSRVGYDFYLELVNADEVNFMELRKLLKTVISVRGLEKRFNKKAARELEDFFNGSERILCGASYSLLSNWFLTSRKSARISPLGHAARELWYGLFCVEPRKRITDWERGYQIIEHRWEDWWKDQVAKQTA